MDEETADTGVQDLPRSKEELMQRIDQAWSDLLATIEGVPEPALIEPGVTGWSIKDNLAHVTAWEQIMLRRYLGGEPLKAVLGVEEEVTPQMDEDAVNDLLFLRNERRPVAEIMEALHDSHRQVVDTLEKESFEKLAKERPANDDRDVRLLQLVAGNTYEHYEHHRGDIERLLLPPVLGD